MIPERRAAEVTPAVCKASAGAVEHLPVARVRNLADFLLGAREAGCWCYGASAAAGRRGPPSGPLRRAPTTAARRRARARQRGQGSAPAGGEACDELIALPLRGRVESLGVAAAAAALLYEILQRSLRKLDKAS